MCLTWDDKIIDIDTTANNAAVYGIQRDANDEVNPLPAHKRGIYFDGTQSLLLVDKTNNTGFYLNSKFTLQYYIRPEIATVGSLLSITNTANDILLRFTATPILHLITTSTYEVDQGAADEVWSSVAVVVDLTSITFYLNDA